MISIKVYCKEGSHEYSDVSDLNTDDGVLRFTYRPDPKLSSTKRILTNCPFFVEEERDEG